MKRQFSGNLLCDMTRCSWCTCPRSIISLPTQNWTTITSTQGSYILHRHIRYWCSPLMIVQLIQHISLAPRLLSCSVTWHMKYRTEQLGRKLRTRLCIITTEICDWMMPTLHLWLPYMNIQFMTGRQSCSLYSAQGYHMTTDFGTFWTTGM